MSQKLDQAMPILVRGCVHMVKFVVCNITIVELVSTFCNVAYMWHLLWNWGFPLHAHRYNLKKSMRHTTTTQSLNMSRCHSITWHVISWFSCLTRISCASPECVPEFTRYVPTLHVVSPVDWQDQSGISFHSWSQGWLFLRAFLSWDPHQDTACNCNTRPVLLRSKQMALELVDAI